MNRQIDSGHGSKRAVLRFFGILLLAIGVILVAIALIDFFSAFGSWREPKLFWCAFLGMPLMFVGIVMCSMGFMGAVSRFAAAEQAPVVKDSFNYVADGIKPGVSDIASAFAAGLTGGSGEAKNVCLTCGHELGGDAKFCDSCGRPVPGEKTCPTCKAQNRPDAKFCDQCGAALE